MLIQIPCWNPKYNQGLRSDTTAYFDEKAPEKNTLAFRGTKRCTRFYLSILEQYDSHALLFNRSSELLTEWRKYTVDALQNMK